MKKTRVSLLAAAAALTFAGSASAQVCAGFPTLDGQFSLAGVANFPEDLDQFGVEGSFNLAGPLALNAAYLNTSGEGDGNDSANTFRGGVSFDVTSLIGPAPATISLCPTAAFEYTTFDDVDGDVNFQSVPVGLGFGTSLPVGVTSSLQPFVVPQVVFSRISADNVDTDWESNFGIRGGANLTFGQFFIGGEINKLFVDEDRALSANLTGDELTFGIKAGIRL